MQSTKPAVRLRLRPSTERGAVRHRGPKGERNRYTIARTTKAGTLVPYLPGERSDGVNHGWLDLRDRPDLVSEIPEAGKSRGLFELLATIAQPISKVMSSACECGSFHRPGSEPHVRWQVGGFVILMFRDAERNTDPDELIKLARYIPGGIAGSSVHHIGYEMIVEPLKTIFGRADCYALMLKALGYGSVESQAWAAFDYATSEAARALGRDRPPAISA